MKKRTTTSEYDMLSSVGCSRSDIEGFEDMLDILYTIIEFRGATNVERRLRSLLKATFLLGFASRMDGARDGFFARTLRRLGFNKR